MAKVKITQVKSTIDRNKKQKATMIALGIKKLNNSVEKELTPQVEGMIKSVAHLLKIENI
ncbi:MAG TPA: 50S ribosomal protein L30 [Chitinophagales bacterium]|nr:50S ribosomal protein L30 [Bacteroidota bacterium]MCB9075712.1 50S ribosomal protein L30 [Chitinophagales bacterium]HMU98085.1 50S ribosomal protein L30 [Chitinophagales bacterium]HMV03253.1 50S ribosomal protein L30 [Chitinophagales bacterium]HMW95106.1 50S ribosomal protein L30 [Chitinophagales bacterium]